MAAVPRMRLESTSVDKIVDPVMQWPTYVATGDDWNVDVRARSFQSGPK